MSIEDELRELIINKYRSIRQFSIEADIPATTIQSMLNSGIENAGVKKVMKICDILGLETDALADGHIKEKVANHNDVTVNEINHIKKYRQLDGYGKKVVDQVLSIEHERILEQSLSNEPQETEHATLIHENRLYMTFYDYGASAGTGNYLDEWDIPKSTISVPDNPETRKADFVLRVCGESMEPDYHDGDRVLVKSQDSVNLNDIAIYIIDGESYIKQYKGSYLHSLNPSYSDIQMNEGQAIKCVGKVIGKL